MICARKSGAHGSVLRLKSTNFFLPDHNMFCFFINIYTVIMLDMLECLAGAHEKERGKLISPY